MEDRVGIEADAADGRFGPRGRGPLAALGCILAVTVAWWMLALWPTAENPQWLTRTREACFGTGPDGLPSAGGWLILIGEPLGMVAILVTVWGRELVGSLTRLGSSWIGRATLGSTAAALTIGIGAVVVRIKSTDRAWATTNQLDGAGGVAVVDRPAPPLALTDQHDQSVSLEQFAGRPVVLTFAFAHCTAVCPAQVAGVLAAGRRPRPARPAVIIVTVDPWRDTPSRLGSIAEGWQLDGDEYVLSGSVAAVQTVLSAWRIRTERNPSTGDIAHPATIFLIGRDGRIHGLAVGAGPRLARAIDRL